MTNDFEADLDDDLLAEALQVAVANGVVSAICSGCRLSIEPEEHEERICLSCGPFTEEVQPVYELPS